MIYYLNGEFVENKYNTIDIRDRGFLLGDGVFTTLKAESGKLISLDKHLIRLNTNTQQIKIDINIQYDMIEEICQNLLIKSDLANSTAIIRITVTRGFGERGINISQEMKPTLLITVFPYTMNALPSLSLGTTSVIRFEKSITSQIKSLNYLESILARDEARKHGFDDAIMLNSCGHIVCTTAANIFFIHKNGDLVTPSLSDGALPGIMRSDIIESEHNLNIVESSIKLSQLDDYIGCFITNSVIGRQTIYKINDKIFSIS